MANSSTWLLIVVAVAIACAGNTVSALWANSGNRISAMFFIMVLLSPLVFITFGLVTARLGLAVSAGTVDALLTMTTMLIGLVLFREWERTSTLQYLGMLLSVIGVCLMVFSQKA